MDRCDPGVTCSDSVGERERDYATFATTGPPYIQQREGAVSRMMQRPRTRAEEMLLRGPPGNNTRAVQQMVNASSVTTTLSRENEGRPPRALQIEDRQHLEDRTVPELLSLSSQAFLGVDGRQYLDSGRERELQGLYDAVGMEWEPTEPLDAIPEEGEESGQHQSPNSGNHQIQNLHGAGGVTWQPAEAGGFIYPPVSQG